MTVCWALCGDISVKYSHLGIIVYKFTLVADYQAILSANKQ